MVTRERGYTLLEVVIGMAIFGMFLMILTMLTAEMRRYEQRLPINFMKHPQISAVISRLRADVLDADLVTGEMYPESAGADDEYEQGPKVLIVNVWKPAGRQTVVWDFRTAGEVKRISYNVGVARVWVARGIPADFSKQVEIDALDLGREYATRIIARDGNGRIAIDQILQPRAHD